MPSNWDQRPTFAAILVVVALLVGAYFGGYYAMLDEGRRIGQIQGDLAERLPKYRSDALAVEFVFWPAHQFDRRIRAERWAAEGIP